MLSGLLLLSVQQFEREVNVHFDLVLFEEIIAPPFRLDEHGPERGDEDEGGDKGDDGEAEGRLERGERGHGIDERAHEEPERGRDQAEHEQLGHRPLRRERVVGHGGGENVKRRSNSLRATDTGAPTWRDVAWEERDTAPDAPRRHDVPRDAPRGGGGV
jgi:hypothetical protein